MQKTTTTNKNDAMSAGPSSVSPERQNEADGAESNGELDIDADDMDLLPLLPSSDVDMDDEDMLVSDFVNGDNENILDEEINLLPSVAANLESLFTTPQPRRARRASQRRPRQLRFVW